MPVTAITMLLNTTGIELVTRREANLQRELTTLGVANVAAASLGGYVSCISLSRTSLTYAAGGRSRICGLAVAAVSALMLAVDPSFLAWIPKFVLGGLLLYLGAALMYEWLVDAARRISLVEYASLLAIALLIVQVGFIAGVLIGVIIGCATFAVSASRVDAVKFTFDGSEYRSTLDRGSDELGILTAHGHEIQGMSLQSYLFFGSANRLYERVKTLFADQPNCRFLVFDFRLVTGLDSSATHRFHLRSSRAPKMRAPVWCWSICRASCATPFARRASSLDAVTPVLGPRSCAGDMRARGHCGTFGRRRRYGDLARLADPNAWRRRIC